jgi:hypothetical protein
MPKLGKHTFIYWPIESMENIPSFIGQLKALQEFDLARCGSL